MRIRILVVSFHLLRIKYFFFSIEVHVVNIGAYAQFQMMYSSFLIKYKICPDVHTAHHSWGGILHVEPIYNFSLNFDHCMNYYNYYYYVSLKLVFSK